MYNIAEPTTEESTTVTPVTQETTPASHTPTTTLPTTTTTEPAEMCEESGRYALPGCHKYVVCWPLLVSSEDLVMIYSCPKGHLFDNSKQHCVEYTKAPAECFGTTTTTEPSSKTTEGPTTTSRVIEFTTTGPHECEDAYPLLCSVWANMGDCDSNAEYMAANCKKSCQMCGKLHVCC